VSIGLAGPSPRRQTPAEVLRAADRALYRAKNGGRNRLVSV
jgi:PleD family two-component response regulator